LRGSGRLDCRGLAPGITVELGSPSKIAVSLGCAAR
jgi:hypothetical protein